VALKAKPHWDLTDTDEARCTLRSVAEGHSPAPPDAGPVEESNLNVPGEVPPANPPAGLPPDAYVVIGGWGQVRMSSEGLTNKVTTAHDLELGWALSVISEPDFDPDELIRRRRQVAPNSFLWPSYRVSTVGELQAQGYDVVTEGSRGHAQIRFPAEPNENDWVTLRAAFGPARPCPP
jgi:hypothetical protein